MAGLEFEISLETGDYIRDSTGNWKTTRNASVAIYHQVKSEAEGLRT